MSMTSQRYRDTRSGEIKTELPLFEIPYFDEYHGDCQVGEFDNTPDLEPAMAENTAPSAGEGRS